MQTRAHSSKSFQTCCPAVAGYNTLQLQSFDCCHTDSTRTAAAPPDASNAAPADKTNATPDSTHTATAQKEASNAAPADETANEAAAQQVQSIR